MSNLAQDAAEAQAMSDDQMIETAARTAARAVAHEVNEHTLALAFTGLIYAAKASALGAFAKAVECAK